MSDVMLTPYPTDAVTRALPSAKTGDSRVEIGVPAGTTWQHDDWTPIVTVDGMHLFIRRADCGAGCRCAAEIAATPQSWVVPMSQLILRGSWAAEDNRPDRPNENGEGDAP